MESQLLLGQPFLRVYGLRLNDFDITLRNVNLETDESQIFYNQRLQIYYM